jgi:hypothetical protein
MEKRFHVLLCLSQLDNENRFGMQMRSLLRRNSACKLGIMQMWDNVGIVYVNRVCIKYEHMALAAYFSCHISLIIVRRRVQLPLKWFWSIFIR